MKKISLALIPLLAFTFLSVVMWPHAAHALTVSPVTTEITADAGVPVGGHVTLFNEGDSEVTYYSVFETFTAGEQDGVPEFLDVATDLATWITITPSITLQPKERQDIPFLISVPAGTDAGGDYAAILWTTVAPTVEGNGVGVASRLGTLVMLTVSGPVTTSSSLTARVQPLVDHLPVVIEYEVKNDGGDRIVLSEPVVVYNTFGQEVSSLSINPGNSSVLPRSTRGYSVGWQDQQQFDTSATASDSEKKAALAANEEAVAAAALKDNFFTATVKEISDFHLGRYTAVTHSPDGTEVKVSFFVLPWQLLIVIFIVVMILLFQARKKYKEAQKNLRNRR